MSTLNLNIFNKKIINENIKGISPDEDFEALVFQCRQNKINFDQKKLRKAFDIVLDVFRDSVYYNHQPRYTHPLEVAMIITKEIPLDEVSVISALLHDIWSESDKYDFQHILDEFGSEVANIVDGMHKIRGTQIEILDQPDEIEKYRKVLLAISTDFRVILVKLADTLENMRNSQFKSEEEQLRLARETFEIYNPFANRLGLRNLKWELDDLAFKILNPFEYESISNYLTESKAQRDNFITKFSTTIQDKLEKDEFLKRNKITFDINGRAKHIFSIHNKMRLRKKNIDELFDLFAIRVVLTTLDPYICFYVYGLIASVFPPVPETFKDYISSPKKNGYKSIHTAVFGLENKIVEVQIRTLSMHYYSESGVAAHFRYKTNVQSNSVLEKEEIQKWMQVVREIFENPGEENSEQILDEVRSNLFADEIYVYTPTNEFVNLPQNSTPLDFAYHIHSDIGHHFVGAKVNGKMVSIDYRLRNGDKVEIIISGKAKPTEDWLEFTVTSRARNQLHKFFKTENKNKEFLGKEKWKKEVLKRKITIDDTKLLEFLREINISRISDFYISLANDEIETTSFGEYVIKKLFKKDEPSEKSTETEIELNRILQEITSHTTRTDNAPLLKALSEDVQRYSYNFISKENYNLINNINDLILQYNEILVTKFSYDITKNKISGELVFETDDAFQASSLLNHLKEISGIYQVNNS
jgi:GTP pyrophosphokinase